MLTSNPADWIMSHTLGEHARVGDRELEDRLGGIIASLPQATGCTGAMIYLQSGDSLLLVAGNGPAMIAAEPLLSELAEDRPADGKDSWSARHIPLWQGFVGAAAVIETRPFRGVVIVTTAAPRAPLSLAQDYVLRAYADLAGAVLELHAVQVQNGSNSVTQSDRLNLLQSVAVHASDSILITEAEPLDLPGPRILYCNDAFTRTTGYSLEEVLGKTPRILQGPGTEPESRQKLREAFAQWKPVTVELTNYRKDGTTFWVELSIVPVANEQGWFTHWVSVQRDITDRKHAAELSTRVQIAEVENKALANEIRERKRIEAHLLYTAFHDSLTRLRNRAYFMDRLKEVLDVAAGDPDKACAILFLDLDRFKVVNDSLGHLAGDVLLKDIARRLKSCTRPQDTLARIGGDEFAVLIEDAADLSIPVGIAEKILEAFRPPVRIGRQDIFPSTSIGIVQSSPHAPQSPEGLIRDADIAMYAAKRSGFGEYSIFDESMHAKATAMLNLQSDLQLALDRGEFELAYQPIVDAQQGRIKGFEALIRWRHPVRGLVSPADFVPIAEEIGLIRAIGRWVMSHACAQVAAWRALFPEADLSMSINTSAMEFNDPQFFADLKATLTAFALPPRALELEITEGIFLRPDARIDVILAEMRAHGVRIALDDFGTGYSSLSYINRYPTDTIKIDQSFVRSLCSDDRTMAIVVLIIQLARTLGIDVVAEGVETQEQASLLASMNCGFAQGYYFSKPVSPDDALAMMRQSLTLRTALAA